MRLSTFAMLAVTAIAASAPGRAQDNPSSAPVAKLGTTYSVTKANSDAKSGGATYLFTLRIDAPAGTRLQVTTNARPGEVPFKAVFVENVATGERAANAGMAFDSKDFRTMTQSRLTFQIETGGAHLIKIYQDGETFASDGGEYATRKADPAPYTVRIDKVG